MRISRLLSLAIVACLAGHAVSSSAPQGTPLPPTVDRIPNNHPYQAYPRWLRPTIIIKAHPEIPSQEQPPMTVISNPFRMAVGADGVVHLLAVANTGNFSRITYLSNRPGERQRDGFSAPITIKEVNPPQGSGGGFGLEPGALAVSRDGKVAAAYIRNNPDFVPPGTSPRHADVHLRVYTPGTGWGPEQLIADGYLISTQSTQETVWYSSVDLAYDSAGDLHAVVYESFDHSTPPNPAVHTVSLRYSKNGGPLSTIVSAQSAHLATTDKPLRNTGYVSPGYRPKIQTGPAAADGTGVAVHVAWLQEHHPSGPANQVRVRHAVLNEGSWAIADVTSGAASSNGLQFDMAVGQDGAAHVVYSPRLSNQFTNLQLFYRSRPVAQSFLGEELIITNTGFQPQPWGFVATDARRKPVVLFIDTDELQTFWRWSLATKVDNPTVTAGSWVFQRTVEVLNPPPRFSSESNLLQDMAVSPGSGFIHSLNFFSGNFGQYWRSTELNIGAQDAFTEVPFGPNAAANVVTGNLRFELPLFAARSGKGFASSMSLIYNSQEGTPGTMSQGWSTNHDTWLIDHHHNFNEVFIDTAITVRFAGGRQVTYFMDASLNYYRAMDEFGEFSSLVRNTPDTGKYTLTTKSGIKYIFGVNGRLDEMSDTNNNKLTYVYGDNTLSPDTQDLLLMEVQDSNYPSRSAVLLEYDNLNRLKKVTDPGLKTYTLAYQDPVPNEMPKLASVTFDAGSAGDPVKWKFEYYTQDNYDPGANPPKEEHRHLLSKVFTPRGSIEDYFHQFGYAEDGRVVSSTEALESSVTNDGATGPNLPVSNVQNRMEIAHLDPGTAYQVPNELQSGTVTPSAQIKDRRGFVTKVEFQRKRCLADRVEDAQEGIVRRFFDGYDVENPANSVPALRNLKRFLDKEGNETLYVYTHEDGQKEMPAHVKDNVRKIFQPAANSTDPSGPNGVAASTTKPVVLYTYKDFFSRVATVEDFFDNKTEYEYNPTTGNLLDIRYPNVAGQGVATESFAYV